MSLFSGKCNIPAGSTSYDDRGTAYNTMKWIAIGCACATVFILLVLKSLHIHSYTRPKEQRQIVRILIAPSVWALLSMGQILNYRVAQYIQPLGDVYESIYLCCVFLLFIQYAAPDSNFDGDMFRTVSEAHEGEDIVNVDWPRLTWLLVFQFPVVNAVSTLITEIAELEGVYCNGDFNPKFAYIWTTIIQSLTLGVALGSIWRFYEHMEKRLRARRGLAKLVGFKAVVGIIWLQQIIFGILISQKVLKPSKTFSYLDLLYGLPGAINCAEMVCFALWFCRVCSPNEYAPLKQGRPSLPVWKAILDSQNPKDWILGIARIFHISMYMHQSGGFKQWRESKSSKKAGSKELSASLLGVGNASYNPIQAFGSENRGTYTRLPEPEPASVQMLDRPTQPSDYGA